MSMTRRDTIAEAVLASRTLFHRYLAGFDDTNHTRQGENTPNHVAWCLGHCALTLHRGIERINRAPPPESDFFSTPADLAMRMPPPQSAPSDARSPVRPRRRRCYNTETVAFQSVPTDNSALYPRFDAFV